MAQDRGDVTAAAGTRLGMAIGKRNDFLHVLSVGDLLTHKNWDPAKVDLVDSSGRPIPFPGGARTTTQDGPAAADAQEVYRRRLLAVCRNLADRIEREPGLATFTGGVEVLRNINGTLPQLMEMFVWPASLPADVARAGTDPDTDPTDSQGFWHNLWHKAFD